MDGPVLIVFVVLPAPPYIPSTYVQRLYHSCENKKLANTVKVC
jgi:hypothetical protein